LALQSPAGAKLGVAGNRGIGRGETSTGDPEAPGRALGLPPSLGADGRPPARRGKVPPGAPAPHGLSPGPGERSRAAVPAWENITREAACDQHPEPDTPSPSEREKCRGKGKKME